jgi:hypothetical protein
MTPQIYLEREQQPERVPLYLLVSMINALEMNRDEFVEFSTLTSKHIWD